MKKLTAEDCVWIEDSIKDALDRLEDVGAWSLRRSLALIIDHENSLCKENT